MLTDLQERRIFGSLNKISLGIYLEQSRPSARQLATEEERRVELLIMPLESFSVGLVNIADRRSHQPGRPEHAGDAEQASISPVVRPVPLFDQIDHRLGDSKISGRQQTENTIAGTLPDGHFAIGRDVVHARIRPRIRQHHQPLVDQHPNAVRHLRFPRITTPGNATSLLSGTYLHLNLHLLIGRSRPQPPNGRRIKIVTTNSNPDVSIGWTYAVCNIKSNPSQIVDKQFRPGVTRVKGPGTSFAPQVAAHVASGHFEGAGAGNEYVRVVLANTGAGGNRLSGGMAASVAPVS